MRPSLISKVPWQSIRGLLLRQPDAVLLRPRALELDELLLTLRGETRHRPLRLVRLALDLPCLLRLLDLLLPMSTFALNIVTGAGLGLGIDYSLLLVSRYREELVRHGPGADAVRATLATAGRTVAFSSS